MGRIQWPFGSLLFGLWHQEPDQCESPYTIWIGNGNAMIQLFTAQWLQSCLVLLCSSVTITHRSKTWASRTMVEVFANYNLLLGTPTSLDLLSTALETRLTSSLGRWRGVLSHDPPSTTNVVPLMNFPVITGKCTYNIRIGALWHKYLVILYINAVICIQTSSLKQVIRVFSMFNY